MAVVAALMGPANALQTGTSFKPTTVHTPFFDPLQRWGERTEVAGLINNDAVNDVWIATPAYDKDNNSLEHRNVGRVYLIDGKTLADPHGNKDKPNPLVKLEPPEEQRNKFFGFWIENPGDLNADGKSELAVGTDAQDVPFDPTENSQICESHPERCNQNQGKVWVFDGKTHNVLYELNNPRPQGTGAHRARFGSRIGTAGDVNGNGVNDIIVGASGNDNPESWRPTNGGDGCSDDGIVEPGCRVGEGQAFVFEGANGALIRELKLPDSDENPATTCPATCGSLGLAVQGPGDVDGDGVPDVLVNAGSYTVGSNNGQGRMYVYSGAVIAQGGAPLGDVIRRIDDPAPQAQAIFGFQDVTHKDPGDVNNDGRADLYGNGFTQAGKTGVFDAGRAWVFDGGSSGPGVPGPGTPLYGPGGTVVLYEFSGHPSEAKYGAQVFWSMTRDRNRNPQPGQTNVDDEDPVQNPILTGAAPHHAPANPDQTGELNTFNAATGAHIQYFPLPPPWNLEKPGHPSTGQLGGAGPNLGPNLGWTVSSPGDLNGDGFRDFIGGAPFTNVCEILLGTNNKRLNVDQGVVITFLSSPSGDTTPVNNSSDKNPVDNVCEETGPNS